MPKYLYWIFASIALCVVIAAIISFYRTSVAANKTSALLGDAQRMTLQSDSIIKQQQFLIQLLLRQSDSLTSIAQRLETDNKTIIKTIDKRLVSVNRDIDRMVSMMRSIEVDTIR
jgi:guanylate kinase